MWTKKFFFSYYFYSKEDTVICYCLAFVIVLMKSTFCSLNLKLLDLFLSYWLLKSFAFYSVCSFLWCLKNVCVSESTMSMVTSGVPFRCALREPSFIQLRKNPIGAEHGCFPPTCTPPLLCLHLPHVRASGISRESLVCRYFLQVIQAQTQSPRL